MTFDKIAKVKLEMNRLQAAIKKMEHEAASFMKSYCGGKHTGAVRRSSLDLTRALAELRKP